jgi:hypothetical protein
VFHLLPVDNAMGGTKQCGCLGRYSIPTHRSHFRASPECPQPTPLSWPQTFDMQRNDLRNPVASHIADPIELQFTHVDLLSVTAIFCCVSADEVDGFVGAGSEMI